MEELGGPQPPSRNIRPAGLTTFRSDSVSHPGPYAAPPRRKVKRGFPKGSQLPRTPANSHLVQPRLTKSCEFSGRPTRGNSRIEATRPVRYGLPPPPSRPANLYRDETRAGFPYGFRSFAEVGCNTRRAGSAERAALSVPVSDLDFRGERLRQREDPSVRWSAYGRPIPGFGVVADYRSPEPSHFDIEGVGTTISDRTAIIGTRSRSGTAIRSLRAAPCTASRLRLPVRQCA